MTLLLPHAFRSEDTLKGSSLFVFPPHLDLTHDDALAPVEAPGLVHCVGSLREGNGQKVHLTEASNDCSHLLQASVFVFVI